jgi:hypothetical protein
VVHPRRRVPQGEGGLGGTLAKFSVSALIFDHDLAGPVSGVSAGQCLASVTNEMLAHARIPAPLNVNGTATGSGPASPHFALHKIIPRYPV